MKVISTEIPASPCLNCGRKLDGATGLPGNKSALPKPDDYTVCVDCGHVMAFASDLTMRNLTIPELVGLSGNKAILAIQERARSKRKN